MSVGVAHHAFEHGYLRAQLLVDALLALKPFVEPLYGTAVVEAGCRKLLLDVLELMGEVLGMARQLLLTDAVLRLHVRELLLIAGFCVAELLRTIGAGRRCRVIRRIAFCLGRCQLG